MVIEILKKENQREYFSKNAFHSFFHQYTLADTYILYTEKKIIAMSTL